MPALTQMSDPLRRIARDAQACGLYRTAMFAGLGAAALELEPIASRSRKPIGSQLNDDEAMALLRALDGLRVVVEALHRIRTELPELERHSFERVKIALYGASRDLGQDGAIILSKIAESLKMMAIDDGRTELAAFFQKVPREPLTPFDEVGVECGMLFLHLIRDQKIDTGTLRELGARHDRLALKTDREWSEAVKMRAHYEFFRIVLSGKTGAPVDHSAYVRVLELYARCPFAYWHLEWSSRGFVCLAH